VLGLALIGLEVYAANKRNRPVARCRKLMTDMIIGREKEREGRDRMVTGDAHRASPPLLSSSSRSTAHGAGLAGLDLEK
jgi:hypothetical protein